MTDPIARVRQLIEYEKKYAEEMPAWEITVIIPREAGEDFREKVFMAIADLAYDQQPEERDWDVFVSSSPRSECVPVHLLEEALDN